MKKKCCEGKGEHYWRNWIGFCILGTINNLGYVVIISAAKSLSEYFNEQSLLGLIPWANVALGFAFRALNTFGLEKVPFKWRMLANTIIMGLGTVGLVFSIYVDFVFALCSIVLLGGSSSFGESILLGYSKLFPSETVGGWSTGTGIAGVGGAGLYLLFCKANLSSFFSLLNLNFSTSKSCCTQHDQPVSSLLTLQM